MDCTVDIEIGEGWYWKLQLQNCIRFKITFLSILYSLSDLESCLPKRQVKWRFWLDFSQDGIHTATLLQRQSKQSMEPSRGGFQGRSLLKYCNQVSCGENKAFNGMHEREEGTFPSETHRSALGLRQRREGNSKDALQSTSSGSSAFWCTKCSLPRTLTHTCVCAGHSTQPRKKHKARLASSTSSALLPRRSLYPATWSKFVYVCGVTLQVTSKTPTQRTLCSII